MRLVEMSKLPVQRPKKSWGESNYKNMYKREKNKEAVNFFNRPIRKIGDDIKKLLPPNSSTLSEARAPRIQKGEIHFRQ